MIIVIIIKIIIIIMTLLMQQPISEDMLIKVFFYGLSGR